MRRPRPLRPIIRGIRNIAPRKTAPPKLIEAHRLFEKGEYEKAAALFETLAEGAEARGIPQAPNLYLRSAAAWIKAENLSEAEDMIRKGLGYQIDRKKWHQLKQSTTFTVDRLRENGQREMADKISDWVDSCVPPEIKQSSVWLKPTSVPGRSQMALPSNCSNCGGPVNPKEIEWFNSANPICSFCGSIIRND